MKRFILPCPPAVNAMYRRRSGYGMFKTAAAHDFANECHFLLAKERPAEGDVSLEIHFYYANRLRDIDGGLKATLDALEGHLYINDRQIVRLVLEKHFDKTNPRVEILVT